MLRTRTWTFRQRCGRRKIRSRAEFPHIEIRSFRHVLARLQLDALLIGAGCRWFDIPVPSPPKLAGALLIVAMTLGYMATDKLIADKFSSRGSATTKEMCGGPTGDVVSPPRLPD